MGEDRDRVPIFVVGGIAVLAVLSWCGGALACLEVSGTLPDAAAVTGLRSLLHPTQPGVGWHRSLSPTLYWANVTAVTAVVTVTVWQVWSRCARATHSTDTHSTSGEGFATARTVRAAAGARGLLARAAILRPALDAARASDLGFRLGRHAGAWCWASIEDSLVILGPPRSGKGLHLVIPAITDAPGAVITTSTRPDNLHATITARRDHGPVAVFDPQRLAGENVATIRWSPLNGCVHPPVAMARARVLCAKHADGVENSSFWAQQSETVIRCLLHAAALAELAPADLLAWTLSPLAAAEAATILRHDPRAIPSWATALEAILACDVKQRDSVWAVVGTTFSALADPRVLEAVSPRPGERFDAETFLLERGTLYLLGTASGATATASLVNALIEELIDTARRLAAAAPGGRIEPPLALILDEAANYPLPSLPALMSEGGGSGISTQVVLQSLAQARATWGSEHAAAIWDAAVTKIVLGGGANATDLRDLSLLAGTKTTQAHNRSTTADGSRTHSSSEQDKPVLDVGALRTIAFGQAILLLRAAPPIRLTLEPWTSRARRTP